MHTIIMVIQGNVVEASLKQRLYHSAPAPGFPGPGPGPGPGPAPAPAPVPAPTWMYDKKGTLITDQFSGKENMGLPEHGFHGRDVDHNDMETMADDWRDEYGPTNPRRLGYICAENPKSYWCSKHAIYMEAPKVGARKKDSIMDTLNAHKAA